MERARIHWNKTIVCLVHRFSNHNWQACTPYLGTQLAAQCGFTSFYLRNTFVVIFILETEAMACCCHLVQMFTFLVCVVVLLHKFANGWAPKCDTNLSLWIHVYLPIHFDSLLTCIGYHVQRIASRILTQNPHICDRKQYVSPARKHPSISPQFAILRKVSIQQVWVQQRMTHLQQKNICDRKQYFYPANKTSFNLTTISYNTPKIQHSNKAGFNEEWLILQQKNIVVLRFNVTEPRQHLRTLLIRCRYFVFENLWQLVYMSKSYKPIYCACDFRMYCNNSGWKTGPTHHKIFVQHLHLAWVCCERSDNANTTCEHDALRCENQTRRAGVVRSIMSRCVVSVIISCTVYVQQTGERRTRYFG